MSPTPALGDEGGRQGVLAGAGTQHENRHERPLKSNSSETVSKRSEMIGLSRGSGFSFADDDAS